MVIMGSFLSTSNSDKTLVLNYAEKELTMLIVRR